MITAETMIKDGHKIPCGAIHVSSEATCRRGLRDSMDRLLDRLTRELHPPTLPYSLQGNGKLLQDTSGKL